MEEVGIATQIVTALLGETPIERVMIALMGFWIWWQQRHINRIQERRIEGAMKVADAANTFSGALDRNTDALKSFVLEDD